ncbi:MAG: acetyl-CoA decarbonylase/synthase complex subunit alpha/beta [Candidatus Zipacnadales bacterium]
MSRIVTQAAVRGAHDILRRAESLYQQCLEKYEGSQEIGFPETAYYLPMIYALLDQEISKLHQLEPVLKYLREELIPKEPPADKLWLPYLSQALDAGITTLIAEEIFNCLRYLEGTEPHDETWHGFISDTILRTLGIQLVDGRMPGFAAIVGAAPTNELAVEIVRELQKRNILTFLIGNHEGRTVRDQLLEENVITEDPHAGWDIYIVPLGPDTESIIYALNWAIRGALTFGGHKRGDWKACLDYTRARIFAFGLGLGTIDDLKYASGAGAITMGFPVICDTPIPEIRPTGVCTYEELVRELDHHKLVPTAIEVRGVKVKVSAIDVPVPVAAAFEGETVRKADMYCQMGGKYSTSFEYLRMREMDEVVDGKIEVIGPDVDTVEEGGAMPLGILAEVAGRKMQPDFEPILERHIHTFINHAMGIFHMGQRDMSWLRISKAAYQAGFRLRHFGEVLRGLMMEDFPALVDKMQVTIYSDEEAFQPILEEARRAWKERDDRLAGMTDESVDTFYSCTLCQSYAPNHVCIISPQRLGLCGAYNWLDGRAAYEIDPNGPNQPVAKGACIDPVKGQWKNINEFVYQASNRTVERFNAYSLMEDPMTSCGCFECIVTVLPDGQSVMVVNREYAGDTPLGMPFSTLASSVGGGHQTPGFLGVGRLYLVSPKFISAEGGLPRIAWMPKELKEALRERLEARAEEMGIPGFVDKIADETITTEFEGLVEHMIAVEHPALTMPSLLG